MSQPLTQPIRCSDKNAWLGIGYYFWTEELFAHYWGQDFKSATGAYDIYSAELFVDKCINTVFDEEGYFYFCEKVEQAIRYFEHKKINVSLEQVNRFLSENIWNSIGIEGVIYDDKPVNAQRSGRIYSSIPPLFYKKRIQIVLFGLKNIHTFALHLEEQTNED